MKRKRYRNGDPITLACGCDGCTPSSINGILCHETGCPESWRDRKSECFECGDRFYAKGNPRGNHTYCSNCARSLYGHRSHR